MAAFDHDGLENHEKDPLTRVVVVSGDMILSEEVQRALTAGAIGMRKAVISAAQAYKAFGTAVNQLDSFFIEGTGTAIPQGFLYCGLRDPFLLSDCVPYPDHDIRSCDFIRVQELEAFKKKNIKCDKNIIKCNQNYILRNKNMDSRSGRKGLKRLKREGR